MKQLGIQIDSCFRFSEKPGKMEPLLGRHGFWSPSCDEKAVLKISSFTVQFLTAIWFMNKTTVSSRDTMNRFVCTAQGVEHLDPQNVVLKIGCPKIWWRVVILSLNYAKETSWASPHFRQTQINGLRVLPRFWGKTTRQTRPCPGTPRETAQAQRSSGEPKRCGAYQSFVG